jgi:hypothetical protein
MPIGTIIGFFFGAFLTAALVLLTEANNDLMKVTRTSQEMWAAEHRCKYIFWAMTSLFGLIGTIYEMSLS